MTREEANQYIEANRVEKEKKPVFHLTTPVGWMNDPNGFSIFEHKAHMFYQFHPYSEEWGPMHWGHAISEDYLHWDELPVALAPDSDFDYAGCFSGTAIERDGQHIIFYTGVTEEEDESGNKKMLQNQCMAIGDGKHYKKVSYNPVIDGAMLPEHCSRNDFRDPKVFVGDDGQYYIIAGNKDSDDMPQVLLFRSADLTNWEFVSVFAKGDQCELGTMWECPDFFKVDGREVLVISPQYLQAGAEFHNGNNVAYLLGAVDYEHMTFSFGQAYSLDYGFDFYAPQTVETEDGRHVMIGWLQSWDSVAAIPKENKWAGMMSVPRELRVENERIYQRPIRELEQCRQGEKIVQTSLSGSVEYDGISGRVMDMNVEVGEGDYSIFEIKLAVDEQHETSVIYHADKGVLEFDRTFAGWTRDICTVRKVKLRSDLTSLRFVMDKNSIELFVNDGEQVLSSVMFTPLTANRIVFSCDGMVELQIKKYDLK